MDETTQEFTWRSHPARERVGPALGALAVIAAVAIAVQVGFQSAAWAIAAAVILVLALNRFFFPSVFTIDAQGITARYLLTRQRMQWADLRRFVCDARGGYLSTRAAPSRLDAYRGMHILFGERRSEIIERVKARLPRGQAA